MVGEPGVPEAASGPRGRRVGALAAVLVAIFALRALVNAPTLGLGFLYVLPTF